MLLNIFTPHRLGAVGAIITAALSSSVMANCPGDFNGDGEINGADLGALLSFWGTPAGDLTNDGDTTGADLGALLSHWGPCPDAFAITGITPDVLEPGTTVVLQGSGFPEDPADLCVWAYPVGGSNDGPPGAENRRLIHITSTDPENGTAVGFVSPVPVSEDQLAVIVAQVGEGDSFSQVPGLPGQAVLGPAGGWAWHSTEDTLIVAPGFVTLSAVNPATCSFSSWAPDPVLIGWASATITGVNAFCPPGTQVWTDIHGDMTSAALGMINIHTDVFDNIVTTAPTTLAQCAFLICTAIENSLELNNPPLDFQCIFLVTGPNSIKILINGDPGSSWTTAFGSLQVCAP